MKLTIITKSLTLFFAISLAIHTYADTSKTGMRNLPPMEFVKDMEAGWNLGNSFDVTNRDKTYWGNPLPNKAIIDAVAEKGFKTIRIPVTWRFHTGSAPEYIIEADYLNRVEEIAKYAFENNMYVIINTHHDNNVTEPTYEKLDEVKDRLGKVWTQIANHFKDYSDYLIFEPLNEPRLEGGQNEWSGGTEENRDCVNQYLKASVDAIRATGGNNAKRYLMITTYAASANQKAIDGLVIPNNDPYSLVSIHTYYPYGFCQGKQTKVWGTTKEKEDLDKEMDKIYNKFIAKGIGVVLGEWGSNDQNNDSERTEHAEYYAQQAVKRGMCPILWDDGGNFRIFNRHNLQWEIPQIAEVIIDAASNSQRFTNPFIKHVRGADPSAHVWNDGKVWVYASHDQDWATDYSSMDGYRAYSSYDLVNWTDHGEILHSRDVDWGVENGGWMFAPSAAFKNDTYYLYFPHMGAGWKWRVGVATSTTPEGPFVDQGYVDGTDQIDPCCFIDDDGQAYLMWGGDHSSPKIAKLKDNMMELAEEPRVIEYGSDNFFEAGYIHKYQGKYYFSWNCNTCWPNTAQYAIGDSPYGPFEYQGTLSTVPDGSQIHNSMIEYHGQSYYFYHVGNWGDDASMYRRNLCVDSMFYNADGTIQQVEKTRYGVQADIIGSTTGILIPGIIEAENYFSQSETSTVVDDSITHVSMGNQSWTQYVLDILGSEIYNLEIKAQEIAANSKIMLYVDDQIKDTIQTTADSDTIKSTLFLHYGKHTLKLLIESNDDEPVQIDWIKLQGEINYYSINASAGEGGSITPEGLIYVAENDSLTLTFDWEEGYQPDSVLIDGLFQSPVSSYTFNQVSSNHTIHAPFTSCTGTVLSPSIFVNEVNLGESTFFSVFEGDEVSLGVTFDGEGEITWSTPNGYSNNNEGFIFSEVNDSHAGDYLATFVNHEGCKTVQSLNMSVNPIELEVYQAEDFTSQQGIQSEGCSDVGNGENIGYIQNGDWTEYKIKIEESGVYDFTARVATETDGGKIKISVGETTLAEALVDGSKTNGWQDWYTTDPIEVKLTQATHTIRLKFTGASGYLFNLNWFDLEFNRSFPNSVHALEYQNLMAYQSDNGNLLNIKYHLLESTLVNLQLTDITGTPIELLKTNSFQESGSHTLSWDLGNRQVANGIYLLNLKTNRGVQTTRVMLFNK